MTRANAAFAQPPEPELGPPTPLLSPGTDLLVFELGSSLNSGLDAYAALLAARDAADKDALRRASDRLVGALSSDPRALARRIAVAVRI